MKYVKMLGLAAVATMALLVFGAGSASATVLCKEYVTPCPQGQGLGAGTKLTMSLRPGQSLTVTDIAKNLIDTCTASTVEGKTTNAGSATETIKGNIELMTYEKCTATFKDVKTGTFEVHYVGPKTTGELTSIGSEVTMLVAGVSCDYGTVGGVDLGLMESDETVSPEFDEETTWAKEEGGFLCPGSIIVKGIYNITAPAKVYFKEKTA
ncbi:MAG: hypothetical protein ACTHK3_00915 [Solirubrobacterales bacterium]